MERVITGHGELDLASRVHVMGILNLTPDSFFDGGRYTGEDNAVRRGIALAEEGADLIDVGGESTRPGAGEVPEEEEYRRVIPVLRLLRKEIPVPVSIDTRKAAIARAALDEGADIINDVSGLEHDPDMPTVAREFGCPVIVMHMKGTPETMQVNPGYGDVVSEINGYFHGRIEKLREAGIAESAILLDPGIGFGKRLADNLRILGGLEAFSVHGRPLVVGPSRKRFIGDILGAEADGRLEGTLAACTAAVLHGASIIRVHDVREAARAVRVADAIRRGGIGK